MIDLTKAEQTTFLRDAYEHKKVAHAYLFVDPGQVTGLSTAYWLACLFNCIGQTKPDGTCINCRRILAGNHPDVLLVKLDAKKTLSIDQVRPLKEELSKSPVEGTTRFFIIADAEKMTLSASNALLNLLEEPIAPVVTVLVTNNENQILQTIRSRTQIINFTHGDQENSYVAAGLTSQEVATLGNTDELAQETKYLYQEIMEGNDLSFLRAHELAQFAAAPQEKLIRFWLKKLAHDKVSAGSDVQRNAEFLKLVIKIDQLAASNVSFRNCLDYLILNFK